MLARGSGTLLFTGASASVKGYAQSAPFAMGKFGLRGLAQSMARELQPKNIHVAHFVIDGGIRQQNDPRSAQRGNDGMPWSPMPSPRPTFTSIASTAAPGHGKSSCALG